MIELNQMYATVQHQFDISVLYQIICNSVVCNPIMYNVCPFNLKRIYEYIWTEFCTCNWTM